MDKPKLKRDWVDRYVRLLRSMTTRGGVVFDKGEVMLVETNRSGLNLSRLGRCEHCGHKYGAYIRHVQEWEVELLPKDYVPEPAPVVVKFSREMIAVFRRMLPYLTIEEQEVVLAQLPELREVST